MPRSFGTVGATSTPIAIFEDADRVRPCAEVLDEEWDGDVSVDKAK